MNETDRTEEEAREAAFDVLAGTPLYDRALRTDISRARARQPEHLRHRYCRICGPFLMDSCPAAPGHRLRPATAAEANR